ncbi:TRAP transporter substrate-binding protein DctP [Pararhodobacter zhoushanensis]|uniref:TRAP transporter substrate-binding protein DctP n=1 Tax=Pararhodobacter zhoushanensis TaxID=2479545 RepID=A0ABT3GZ80_9RHOB|nr:TRAP transporter substrate-binding protein DctP [Pararhodobacter zhoushanensis]MCW1932841.1 TRAP transporter substrate-binding protein DctP [Pararhodobacter zhoushanensis]
MKLSKLAGLTIAASVLAFSAAAQDRVLRIAPAAPPAHPANGVLYTNFAQYLPEESEGRLGTTMLGPEVVNLGQMKDALQSQVAEVGNFLPLYFPAELPYMALAGELSLTSGNSQAAAAAMTQFIVECEPCQQELHDFGFVYLGSGASDVYEILSTRPVHSIADLEGMRLRSGGSPWARFAEHFGAVPAQISVNDTFEAISQGVVDGSMASIADLISFRLVDVITHVTFVPLGLYQATSNFMTSGLTWESLSVEDRAAMARAANRANADFTDRWGRSMPEEAEAAAREAGIELHQADDAFVAAVQEFVATEAASAAQISTERYGIADAEERIARFQELYSSWAAVAEEVNNDPAAMAERVNEAVWANVDYATYGQ